MGSVCFCGKTSFAGTSGTGRRRTFRCTTGIIAGMRKASRRGCPTPDSLRLPHFPPRDRSAARNCASSAQASAASNTASSDDAANAGSARKVSEPPPLARAAFGARSLPGCPPGPCARPPPDSGHAGNAASDRRPVPSPPRAQRRPHPLQHRARPRRTHPLVERHVQLLRTPTRKRPALRQLPVHIPLQHVNRQPRAPALRSARRPIVRHLHPHLREPPRLVQPQLPPVHVRGVVHLQHHVRQVVLTPPPSPPAPGNRARPGCRYTDWSACRIRHGKPPSSRTIRSIEP